MRSMTTSLFVSICLLVSLDQFDCLVSVTPIRVRVKSGELLIGNRKVIPNEFQNASHIVYEFLGNSLNGLLEYLQSLLKHKWLN